MELPFNNFLSSLFTFTLFDVSIQLTKDMSIFHEGALLVCLFTVNTTSSLHKCSTECFHCVELSNYFPKCKRQICAPLDSFIFSGSKFEALEYNMQLFQVWKLTIKMTLFFTLGLGIVFKHFLFKAMLTVFLHRCVAVHEPPQAGCHIYFLLSARSVRWLSWCGLNYPTVC